MWRDDRDQLDAAIDEVAREMTAAAPGAGFRARVQARIGAPRASWPSPWILTPVALAAVLVIAVVISYNRATEHGNTRPGRELAPSTGTVRTPSPPVAQAPSVPERSDAAKPPATSMNAQVPTGARPESTPDAARTPDVAARARSGARAGTRVSEATSASEIEALAPAALDVVTIAIDRLAPPEAIVISRLETTSIALAPIGAGDQP